MQNIKVLIVEDSPEDKVYMTRVIKKINASSQRMNIDFEEVSSLKECFEKLTNNEFDVLLLDLSLPDSFNLPANAPKKELLFPLLFSPELLPKNELESPVVLSFPDRIPKNEFKEPIVLDSPE